MAACTFPYNNATTPVPIASLSNPSTIYAKATPVPPTVMAIPSLTPTQATINHPWWNNTVFYEIFVRSYYDSNSDGIGDFNGLIEKLDYLNDGDPNTTIDLGITGIWLMPIFSSPSTHGYDVTDYYAVNSEYGTMNDFRHLVDEAHQRGIRVLIDLPINHTSSQHSWFIKSQDVQSQYHDWYIWADNDPGWKGAWNQQVWYPLNSSYYYAFFWEGMPDLNYTNSAVTKEMEKITQFWLNDIGIDGFRLDAISSLIEEGSSTIETQASHVWFTNYFKFYKGLNPEAMTIGEIWMPDDIVIPWVANKQVDLAFEFDLSATMLSSITDGNSTRMLETLKSGTRRFPAGQYGTFLTNHDMARVMTQLDGNLEKAKAAASLYFSLPGVPFVYYGEEIGMFGEAPDEQGRRPMQWTGGQYAGFSDVAPWKLPDANYEVFNVSTEIDDPKSLNSHYRALISLRNSHPALQTGDLLLLSTNDQGLFACLRTMSNESMLILVNLSGSPIRNYQLSLASSTLPQGEYTPISLLDETELAELIVLEKGQILNYVPALEIPPYASIIMELTLK